MTPIEPEPGACGPSTTSDPPPSLVLRRPFAAEPVRRVMELVGRRWTLLIFAELSDGPLRRSHLRFRLRGVSDKVLTEVLRELEESDLVTRTYYPGTPPRVDYGLTARGRQLTRRLASIVAWLLEGIPSESWADSDMSHLSETLVDEPTA